MGFGNDALHKDSIVIASFGVMVKFVLVFCSAGNNGAGFGYSHNEIPWVLNVAAGTIDRWFAETLTLGNGLAIIGGPRSLQKR